MLLLLRRPQAALGLAQSPTTASTTCIRRSRQTCSRTRWPAGKHADQVDQVVVVADRHARPPAAHVVRLQPGRAAGVSGYTASTQRPAAPVQPELERVGRLERLRQLQPR